MPFIHDSAHIVVLGAGKIARGHIGLLLSRSGHSFGFVDANKDLVRQLSERRGYSVRLLTSPPQWVEVSNVDAWHVDDPHLVDVLDSADLVFVSVGGPNLPAVGRTLAGAVPAWRAAGHRPRNIVVCENWAGPAEELRTVIDEHLTDPLDIQFLADSVGIAEATVLRTCIEPTLEQAARDPLAVQAQDYNLLQVDGDGLVGDPPPVEGLVRVSNFQHHLTRKLYTYNAVNATISYLGWHLGHHMLAEAANDPRILRVVEQVYDEVNPAICQTFGFTPSEQAAFAAAAQAKFQDSAIPDPLERQVRDPLRKLGPHDRLVGAARFVESAGLRPEAMALSIAAALTYENDADLSARSLQHLVQTLPLGEVLEMVCGLEPDEPLAILVEEQLERVRDGSWWATTNARAAT